MDHSCESDTDVRIDRALRFSVVEKPAPIIEYIKTISTVIGASHILAIFEENDSVKVYFDDQTSVDTLIKSGIHVKGHHVTADYVIPPGTKLVLSSVNPLITNTDLTRVLSVYGTIVSPIFRSPISDDPELCHIDYGVRYVYMIPNNSIPDTLIFNYANQMCSISIKVDDTPLGFRSIKTEIDDSDVTEPSSSTAASNIDIVSHDINNNASGNTNSIITNMPNTDDAEHANPNIAEGQNIVEQEAELPRISRVRHVKSSRRPRKMKRNPKYKWTQGKRQQQIKIQKLESNCQKQEKIPPNVQPLSPVTSDASDYSPMPPLMNNGEFTEQTLPSKNILSDEELQLFLEDIKCHRAPMEYVKLYFGSNFNEETLLCLIEQLSEFSKKQIIKGNMNMRLRVDRLVRTLKENLQIVEYHVV